MQIKIVRVGAEPCTIEAQVKGDFAYHRTYIEGKGTSHRQHNWSVTYVPSGRLVFRTKTKAAAKTLVDMLQPLELQDIFTEDEVLKNEIRLQFYNIMNEARKKFPVALGSGPFYPASNAFRK